MQDDDLNQLLGRAARQALPPSAALMDRILADALALQPLPAAPAHPMARPKEGVLHRLSSFFGGGPVMAGLCSAAVMGVALGYLNPTSMDYLTGGLTGAETETLDLFPSVDFVTTEG